MQKEPKVLIVGAGPTGLVLALWLTKLGIPIRIIDKNGGPGETSRALIIQARTLELYQQIGIAKEVMAQGIKLDYVEFLKNGRSLKKTLIGEVGKELTPYSFVFTLPQDDHEKLLLAYLQDLGVRVERQTTLISLEQNPDGVNAVIRYQGKDQSGQFSYLCGCDGAHSTTREQLGITFPGATYSQLFFVADVETAERPMPDMQLGISQNDFCLSLPVRSSGTLRLIGIVPEPKPQQEITFEQVRGAVSTNLKLHIEKVNWFSTYHAHHRVVTQFAKERVFLCGDAAHIHSPVGGQGMNTGIGDAVNLAWKLAAVLQGNFTPALLQTYEVERKPFAQQLVATTDKMFQIATSSSFPGLIWRGLLFPYLFPLIFKYQTSRNFLFKFISQVRINYRNSPLSLTSQGSLQAGDRLPWVPTASSDNFAALSDLIWQVHVYGKASPELVMALEALGLPLVELPWSVAAQNQHIKEEAAYLIRPDGYIAVIDTSIGGAEIKKMWRDWHQ